MSKHTPGPWTRTPGDFFRHDGSAGVRGADGIYCATALAFNRLDRIDEQEANARLIAAAPTMYEYLEKMASQNDEEARAILEKINANA